MGEGAVDHVGHGLEAPVRMPGRPLGLTRCVVDLPHLVHVHEGIELRQAHAGEGPPYGETLPFEAGGRRGHGSHWPLVRPCPLRRRDSWQSRQVVDGYCRHECLQSVGSLARLCHPFTRHTPRSILNMVTDSEEGRISLAVSRIRGPMVQSEPVCDPLELRRQGTEFPNRRENVMASDHQAAVEEHWQASERGDSQVEHAIYSKDAILDYPQSGERFRGRDKSPRSEGPTRRAALHGASNRRRRRSLGESVHHHLRRRTQLLGQHHGIRKRGRDPRDPVLR